MQGRQSEVIFSYFCALFFHGFHWTLKKNFFFSLGPHFIYFPHPQSCLLRSFKAEVYSCPNCRHQLGKDYSMETNKQLQKVLLSLFPGYDAGR